MTKKNINLIKAGDWIKGKIEFDEERDLKYCLKVFEQGSEYGINGGKISKLEIRLGSEILVNYDRGWDVTPSDEVKPFYESLLNEYN